MATGMWTSAAGAAAQAHAVDIVANNLANGDTVGFKKDQPTFREYLATVERDHGAEDIPRGTFKDKDFYPLDGRDQSYVVVDNTYTSFRQGTLRVSSSPLDMALEGPGFFEVSTPQGIRYTRQGSLKVARDGRLVTTEGHPVLTAQAPNLAAQPIQPTTPGRVPANTGNEAARTISLKDRPGPIAINSDGSMYINDELVAKLSVVEFNDLNGLRKTGGGLFENKKQNNVSLAPLKSMVRQGMIEMSNVNPVEEMTNLIKANRLFEHDLKALKTYGEMLGKEATEIGKL